MSSGCSSGPVPASFLAQPSRSRCPAYLDSLAGFWTTGPLMRSSGPRDGSGFSLLGFTEEVRRRDTEKNERPFHQCQPSIDETQHDHDRGASRTRPGMFVLQARDFRPVGWGRGRGVFDEGATRRTLLVAKVPCLCDREWSFTRSRSCNEDPRQGDAGPHYTRTPPISAEECGAKSDSAAHCPGHHPDS